MKHCPRPFHQGHKSKFHIFSYHSGPQLKNDKQQYFISLLIEIQFDMILIFMMKLIVLRVHLEQY